MGHDVISISDTKWIRKHQTPINEKRIFCYKSAENNWARNPTSL